MTDSHLDMNMDMNRARQNMVENQVRTWDVLDPRVLEVLAGVPREAFVAPIHRSLAFADMALPIGHGEAMMKPVVEGRLLQALQLQPSDRVLEIGTGSGFITACLAHLAREIVSIEQHADFVETARARMAGLGIANVRIECADALGDFATRETFDAVVVTGAVFAIPERFRDWVRPGGRLFAVVGESPAMQAILTTRAAAGHWREESLFETDLPYLRHAGPPQRFRL
jgi:protein-L-isoaspartate(D-aspartate) O-methyltransferase